MYIYIEYHIIIITYPILIKFILYLEIQRDSCISPRKYRPLPRQAPYDPFSKSQGLVRGGKTPSQSLRML